MLGHVVSVEHVVNVEHVVVVVVDVVSLNFHGSPLISVVVYRDERDCSLFSFFSLLEVPRVTAVCGARARPSHGKKQNNKCRPTDT